MARLRRMQADMEGFENQNFDPTIAPTDSEGEFGEVPAYQPPNGNTGISGYMPGGKPMPSGGISGSGTAQGRYQPYGGTTGYQPTASQAQQATPEFNGDYLGYIQSFLTGDKADRNVIDQHEADFAKVGIKNQRASDGTSRGRLHLPNGNYVDVVQGTGWGDSWANLREQAPYVPQAGGGGGAAPAGGPTAASNPELWEELRKLYTSGGGYNQDIVNRRTENAATKLRSDAKSRVANNEAYMASRGLIGSGAQATSYNKVEDDIFDQYTNAVSGIHADESAAADDRMIQALSLASGLSTSDADRALGYLNANNDFALGQGNLALGNLRATNDWNLGLGRFGLDREALQHSINSGNIDQIIELLQLYLGGVNTSSGGHI